ncbi:tRNA (adenosine(37)-N6)-dimethylallyltransferase MiaA [Candidatus Margulisiibacteriota bacterium]
MGKLNNIIIIFGPTAVGKTDVSIKLAKKLNGEIISADSMQVYKGMDIGTAKPAKDEMKGIPHHLIDIRDPNEAWSVSDFISGCKKLTQEIIERGKLPIIVGGTGFYLNALIEGFSFPELKANKEIRERLSDEAKDQGSLHLHEKLKKIDPKTAERLHHNDTKRMIRALEIYELTGKPMSELESKGDTLPYEVTLIGLNMDRKELYKKIEDRVDKMLEAGLIEEVKGLLDKGYDKHLTSMEALGYKETIDHIRGKYDQKAYVELLKKNTRNFAKRQLTWFRRFKNAAWFDVNKDFSIDKILKSVS